MENENNVIQVQEIKEIPKTEVLKPIEEKQISTNLDINQIEKFNTLEQQLNFANILIQSKALPPHYKNAESVLLSINYGKELGFTPIVSILGVYFVNGTPSLSTQSMCALANSLGVAQQTLEDFALIKNDKGETYKDKDGLELRKTTIRYSRLHPTLKILISETFSFTNWEAKQAGLLKNVWLTYPKIMLWYRTYALGLRRFAPDILKGLYTIEEILDISKDSNLTYDLDSEGNIKVKEK